MEEYQRAVQLWQSWNIRTAADLDRHLDSFRILFAYHSGKIENEDITYNDTREIFENGRVMGYTGDPRALFEQQNQKLCYEVLKQRLTAREPLSVELVREIHRILTSGAYDERRYIVNGERPGEFKKHDYVIGIHEVGSPPKQVLNDFPPLIVYEEDRNLYYEALKQYDEEEILEPLESFFKGQTVKTWARTMEQERGSKRQNSLTDYL